MVLWYTKTIFMENIVGKIRELGNIVIVRRHYYAQLILKCIKRKAILVKRKQKKKKVFSTMNNNDKRYSHIHSSGLTRYNAPKNRKLREKKINFVCAV